MGIKISNNATTTLAGSIADVDLSLAVATGTGALFATLGVGDYQLATLKDAAGNIEIIKVTARASDAFTIERGQEGTTARAWASGDRIAANLTAGLFATWATETAAAAVATAVASAVSTANAYTDGLFDALKGGVSSAFDTLAEIAAKLVNFTGDSGSGGVQGFVPAPATGDAAAHKYLHADGTWKAPATAAEVRAGTAGKVVTADVANSSMDWVALTYGATMTIDHRDGVNRSVTVTGNGAFAAPTNAIPGIPLNIAIKQDATGTRVPTFNAAFDFGDAGTPTLSTGANQQDLLTFICISTAPKFAFLGIRKRID